MESDRNQQGVQVNLPNNIAILYTDSAFLSVNQFGVVLDFAQRVGSTNQQNIVVRIGMSKEHAKALVTALGNLLEKNQLQQEKLTFSPSKKKMVS